MTRLDEAQDKLARALTKLEKASRDRPVGHAGADTAQTEALARDLQASRMRYDTLQAETRSAGERLDRTIERVRGLLAD